ncbi:MAG: hypothetical protein PHS48_02045 [Bacteroidales bacterium]|nr:hypothetical protein [Bacteroidales bacterium]
MKTSDYFDAQYNAISRFYNIPLSRNVFRNYTKNGILDTFHVYEEDYNAVCELQEFFNESTDETFDVFYARLNEKYGVILQMADSGKIDQLVQTFDDLQQNIKTIKNCLMFFVVMTILGIIASIIVAYA